MHHTLIIGGGVAGLMAAIHLAERSLPPVLLEADPQWIGGRLKGGPVVTLAENGQSWSFAGEHAVHGIWSPYHNFKAVLSRHTILPALVPARDETWIFGAGKQVRRAAIGNAIRGSPLPAPFHYLYCFLRPSFLNVLTPRDIITLPRVLMSLFAAMAIDPLAEGKSLERASLADFTRGWSPRLRSLLAGLARSGLSAQPAEVPLSGWIAFLRFYTLLRRDAWAFAYLPGTGGGCVAEPLAAVARNLGVDIRMGCTVTQLDCQDGRWQVTYHEQTTGQPVTLAAEHVILATDAPAAAKLLRTSPTTAATATSLRFPQGTPSAVIRLWFKTQPRPMAEAGIYSGDFVMDNFFWLHRLQPEYSAWSQATGGSALEMHIYSTPELLAQPDAALLARVITDTYRAFPELTGQLRHAILLRNEATHTLFCVGEPATHLGIATPWPNLFTCGDWVYHPAPALYLERATLTGLAAANAVLVRCGQAPWPLAPYPPPEWLAGKIAALLRRGRQHELQRRRARTTSG